MKKKPRAFYFKFYPGEYLRDTQNLSEKAQVAYDRIMCEHMRNICLSYAQHTFFTKRLNADEKGELLMVLEDTGEGYRIPWVVDSISQSKAYSESRSENRAGKTKDHMITYDHHMDSNSNSNSNSTEKEKEDSKEKKKKEKKPQKIMVAPEVKLTTEENDRLILEFGADFMNRVYNWYANYKIEKGWPGTAKDSKNDNLTIRRWVIDAVKKQTNGTTIQQQQQQQFSGRDAGAKYLVASLRADLEGQGSAGDTTDFGIEVQPGVTLFTNTGS